MSDIVRSEAFKSALKSLTTPSSCYAERGTVKLIGKAGGYNAQQTLQRLSQCCGSTQIGHKTYIRWRDGEGVKHEVGSWDTPNIIVYDAVPKDYTAVVPKDANLIRLPQEDFDLVIKWEDK